jgi:hypothetical protein
VGALQPAVVAAVARSADRQLDCLTKVALLPPTSPGVAEKHMSMGIQIHSLQAVSILLAYSQSYSCSNAAQWNEQANAGAILVRTPDFMRL